MAIDESANLAQERGSYMHFKGSEWSKGKVPIDSLVTLENGRGKELTVSKVSKHKGLNWDILRSKVAQGMRNATLMAVAPNANIGLLAATTPGIDARFAQVFSRNKISGKYLDINHNLVKDLKNLGIWDEVKEAIIENQGDISEIAVIPQHIKDVYKTSFTTSPYSYIEVAARAQKWIDQALSRNMYLETRDVDETMKIYNSAWEKGLKSTYYLHMKPRHTAEQSTINVNKAAKIGKIGFGALNFANSPAFSAPLQKSLVMEEPVSQTFPQSTPKTVEPSVSAPMGGFASVSKKIETEVKPTMAPAQPDIFAEEVMVSTSTYKAESVPVAIKQENVIKVSETKPITQTPINNSNIIGPEDPADANICIDCQ